MLNLKYEDWKSVCEMHLSQKNNRLRNYLQWYPIYNNKGINFDDTGYFYKYINNGSFSILKGFTIRTDNYIQKGDGSFRKSSLLSPSLYLILQTIGKTIYDSYKSERPEDIIVYYAGNYSTMDCFYKKSYDSFYKDINYFIENYSYYIKTDIRDFFNNINVNKLFSQIDKQQKKDNNVCLNPLQLQIFKDLILYTGNEGFPLVENSMASSYLATEIYLDPIDTRLYDFLKESGYIEDFKMVRYVDDLYIFIKEDHYNDTFVNNMIINEYSSILKNYNLSLNNTKTSIGTIDTIDTDLKKSMYDEVVNEKRFQIPELASDNCLYVFLDKLCKMLEERNSITKEEYNNIMKEAFTIENIEFTYREIFNYFAFEKIQPRDINIKERMSKISALFKYADLSFVSFDPKQLMTIILSTEDGSICKKILNYLFVRSKQGLWNAYDTSIAINYLLKRRFQYEDLITQIKKHDKKLYDYFYCCKNTIQEEAEEEAERLRRICLKINVSDTTYYLYFMYYVELDRNNIMSAFAYFKNFFDRVTAELDFYVKK